MEHVDIESYQCETIELNLTKIILVLALNSLAVLMSSTIDSATSYLILIILIACSVFLATKTLFFRRYEKAKLTLDLTKKTLYLSNYPKLNEGVNIKEITNLMYQGDGWNLRIYFKKFFVNLKLSNASERSLIIDQLLSLSEHDIPENNKLVACLNNRKPRITYILLFTITAVFAMQLFYDSSFSVSSLIRLGGNSTNHVKDGEIFRLITANFLHGSLLHYLINVSVIFSFGSCLEKIVTPKTFLILTVFAAILGTTTSVIFRDAVISTSVGASTIIMGYASTLIYVSITSPKWFSKFFAYDYFTLLTSVLLSTLLPFVLNKELIIDHAAHIGGASVIIFFYSVIRKDSFFSTIRTAESNASSK